MTLPEFWKKKRRKKLYNKLMDQAFEECSDSGITPDPTALDKALLKLLCEEVEKLQKARPNLNPGGCQHARNRSF